VKTLVLVGFLLEVLQQPKVVEKEKALKQYGQTLIMKNDFYFNGFKKAKVRWQKYLKIMVKLARTTIRSTELSIAYSPCYSIVLMCL
jgi:hypothetical protein